MAKKKSNPTEPTIHRPLTMTGNYENSPGWVPPPLDPLREFKLVVDPYARADVGDQIREAAIALDRCGLSEVADWVRSIETRIGEEVETRVAEQEVSKEVFEDIAADIKLLVFLGKGKVVAVTGKKSGTRQAVHPIHESWARLRAALNLDVDLDVPDQGDLSDLLSHIDPHALGELVVEACDDPEFKDAIRKALTGRSEGLLDFLGKADVQKLLGEIAEQSVEEVDDYRAEVSRSLGKGGVLLHLLREGDVGDLVRHALVSDDWRAEVLSALAESFEEKPW